MTPARLPGERLLSMARRLFARELVTRTIEPPLADMQAEWLAARAEGRRWGAWLARLRGYWDVLATVSLVVFEDRRAMARSLPFAIIVPAVVAASLGVLVLHGITTGSTFAIQQLAYLAVAMVLLFGVALTPSRWLSRLSWLWLLLGAAALSLVALRGETFDGATRWLRVGSLRIQPGELCKPLLVLALAGAFSRRGAITSLRGVAAGFGMAAILIAPVALEPDAATGIAMLAAVGTMLFVASQGARARGGVVVFSGVLLVALIALSGGGLGGPARALVEAVARGGLLGHGAGAFGDAPLEGRHTDFLLAAVAERFGAVGVLLLVLPLFVLLREVFRIARRASEPFARFAAVGVVAMLSGSLVAHLAFPSGAILLSYGGSSLVAVFLSLGIVAGASAGSRPAERRLGVPG
jgi:cell division protein FtsW (lipid II flippase)